MENKTYLQLEEIGIVATYLDGKILHIIIKGGGVWFYNPKSMMCQFLYNL